jgi:hypothetical protein
LALCTDAEDVPRTFAASIWFLEGKGISITSPFLVTNVLVSFPY